MKNTLLMFAAGAVVAVAVPNSAMAQTVTTETEAVGYVKVPIAAGTGTAKRTTLVSLPLLEEASIVGASSGKITGVGTGSFTVSGAGWQAGQLSSPAVPHLIEITSGTGKGRMIVLSTTLPNTSDTVFVADDETNRLGGMTTLGIAGGDSFVIRPVDTLGSFFGTPETTFVLGGATSDKADTVTLIIDGVPTTCFYNTTTTPPRWTRISVGSPDATNIPIPPYAGVQYSRLANTPLEFVVTGKVPVGERKVAVKNSGSTILSSYWPVNQTLNSLGIQNLAGWKKSATAKSADTVVLCVNGMPQTFYHDGTNWRRVALGTPVSDATSVTVGASVMVNKLGTATGFTSYNHLSPYNL